MASEFVRKMAEQSRQRVDRQVGRTAYGGSDYIYGARKAEERVSPVEKLASEIAAARVQDSETAAKRARARQTYAQKQSVPPTVQLPAEFTAGLANPSVAAAPKGAQVSKELADLADKIAAGQELRQRQAFLQQAAEPGGLKQLLPKDFGTISHVKETAARQYQPTVGQRLVSGVDAAMSGLAGGIGSFVESGKAAWSGEKNFLQDVGLKGFLVTPLNELGEKRLSAPYQRQMDMDSLAANLMDRSAEKAQLATKGLGPAGEWVGKNLVNVSQNAPALLASAVPGIGPFLGGAIMGMNAAGSKAYELQKEGVDAGDAFWRGTVSGGIEAATERYSVEGFWKIAQGTGAKTAAKNILRQMGVEASEESASYVLNYLADKAADDPNATFSLAELADSAAGGAFAGGIFGTAGTAINAVANRRNLGTNGQKNYQYLKERDQGKTPDFDQQHEHYYEAGRSGMKPEQVPAYATQTPVSQAVAEGAYYAGQNDGKLDVQETVKVLSEVAEGKNVSDKALYQVLSFPESRTALERVTGPLSEKYSEAAQEVRRWQQMERDRVKAQTANQQPVADLGNTRQSQTGSPNSQAGTNMEQAARSVLQEYGLDADAKWVAARMENLQTRGNSRSTGNTYESLLQDAKEIAAELVPRNIPVHNELTGQYAELRNYLRTTPVTLGEADRASINDGYNNFRKRNMGRLKLVNGGGVSVDSMYQQLQDDYGLALFPDGITHPADQLERISEVLDGLRPGQTNQRASNGEVQLLAEDLLQRCGLTPQEQAENPAAVAKPESPQPVQSPVNSVNTESAESGTSTEATGIQQRRVGLTQNEHSAHLDAATASRIDRIAKRFGTEVEFSDKLGNAAGEYRDGKITLSRDSENPVMRVFVHELTHHMETSGDYQAFSEMVQKHIENDLKVSFSDIVQRQQADYAAFGENLTEEGARREVIAKFAEDYLFTDERSIQRLAQENRGLVQRIRDWLHDIVARFTGSRETREEARFLQQAERMYEKALANADGRRTGKSQYRIETLPDGEKITVIDKSQDVFKGKPVSAYSSIARRLLLDKFKGQVLPLSDSDLARFQSRQAGEYAYPRTQYAKDSLEYEAKMRAAAELDSLLETAEYSHWAKDGKNHPEATLGFDYYRVKFAVGGHLFEGLVNIANSENGRILYDITKINEIPDTSGKYATLLAQSTSTFGNLNNDSISQSAAENNPQNSGGQRSQGASFEKLLRDAGYKEAADKLSTASQKHGTYRRGEIPARDVQIPKQMDENTRVRRFARTAAEAASLTDGQAAAIGKAVAEGRFSYEPVGDRAARNYAEGMLARGEQAAADAWNRVVARDNPASKNDIALGEYLLKEAAKQGDTERVVQLAAEIAAEGTRAGQVVQAMRLLKRLDGAGQLVSLDAMLKKLQGDLDRDKSGVFLKVSDELRQELANAKGEEEVNAALDKIYSELAGQMPSKWSDKWNAWRYLSMLGNPRTHIRNVLGNAGFEPAIIVKNTIGAALEHVFVPAGERTKSLTAVLPGTGGEARKFAQADFREMRDIITGGGKMNPSDIIRERQRVFKTGALEWVRKQNFNFLEAEDGVFLEHHYVRAMTQYLKANKVDVAALNADSAEGTRMLNRARDYAVREAQKATYRDFSRTAQLISQASRKLGRPGEILIEGILPFKKTPVNVLKRGVEYSPIGLADTLTRKTNQLRKGRISASEYIDSLSAGLTGSGIAALGWLLTGCGVLVGGGEDDKEQDFRDALGAQSWALKFGDTTYTIDWLAPAAMPLFVGSEVRRLYENGMELNGRSIWDAAMTIAEPMTQMSMLDGLNSALSSVRYGDNPLSDLLSGAVTDYFSQAVPTLFGQAARTIDPVRRTTYDDKNSGIPSLIQKTAQKNQNKLPFLSQRSAAYLDIWGREQFSGSTAERILQNFISPGYLKSEKLSAMETELIRLYQATGESGALPGRAAKSFEVEKEPFYLTSDEYQVFAETRGTMMYSGLSEMTAGAYYQQLGDASKLTAVGNMIKLSNAVAKTSVSEYVLDDWHAKAVEGKEKYGISFSTFVLAYSAASQTEGIKDKDGETISSSAGLRKMQAIYNVPGLTQEQREYLFEACRVGKKVIGWNKGKVDQELRKMESQASK